MDQQTFYLSSNSDQTKRITPGSYKITVTGLSDPSAVVYVRARNEADTDWDTAVQITAKDSGIIGAKALTVNSNGLVGCYATGLVDHAGVKVRISS